MPLDDGDYERDKHPPACTCEMSVARRLGRIEGKRIAMCPYCKSSEISYKYDFTQEYRWKCNACKADLYYPHYVRDY